MFSRHRPVRKGMTSAFLAAACLAAAASVLLAAPGQSETNSLHRDPRKPLDLSLILAHTNAVASTSVCCFSTAFVSAQVAPCASLTGSVLACGREFRFLTLGDETSAAGASSSTPFVLKCPSSALTAPLDPGFSARLGGPGPGANDGDPTLWRTCGSYEQLGECNIGETTVHFTRPGEQVDTPLRAHTPLVMMASRSARYFPQCPDPSGPPECEGCTAEFTALFVFEDAAGFATAPVIDAASEVVAPVCNADGSALTSSRALHLSVSLAAPPLHDPAYNGALNNHPDTKFIVEEGGVALTGASVSATGSWQRNDQAMDVLVYAVPSSGGDRRLVNTMVNVPFNAAGSTGQLTLSLPADVAGAQATSVSLEVELRSRSTGLQSAASSARFVTLAACPLVPPSSGGMDDSSTGGGSTASPTPSTGPSSTATSSTGGTPSSSSSSTGDGSGTTQPPPPASTGDNNNGGVGDSGNNNNDDGDLGGASAAARVSPSGLLLSLAAGAASLSAAWLWA
jgi:hypothetical protein